MEKKTFEKALSDLESVVKELEQGDIDLDAAVKKYNEGMELSKYCHNLLKEAENVIVKMMKDDTLEDFNE